MRDWDNVDHRREATVLFAKFMQGNDAIRQKCLDDPKEAKRQFATIGEFYLEGEQLPGQPPNEQNLQPIPASVDFKVYDATDPKRQDSVVLVLPSAKGHISEEATDIWIAAWQPWKS